MAIKQAKDDYEKSKETTAMLADELVKQHKYSEQCHTRSVSLEQKLNTLLTDRAQERVKARGEMKQVTSTGLKAQQELAGQNDLLKARLDKARKNAYTFQVQHGNTLEQ